MAVKNIKSAFNFAECNLVPASLLVGSPEAFGLSSRLYDTLAADWEVRNTGWLFRYGFVVKQKMLYRRQEHVIIPSSSAPLPELDHLRSEVARLQSLVQQINMDRPSRQSSRSSNNSRNSSPRRPPNLCWYHFRFGDSARKCRPPCSKSGNDQASR